MKNALSSMAVKAAGLGVFSALVAFAFATDRPAPSAQDALRVVMTQRPDGRVKVVYQVERPVDALTFDALPGDYRDQRWTFDDADFMISEDDSGERIERRDGQAFKRVVLAIEPHDTRLEKNYQPTARYGAGGVLIYTGHFTPRAEQGRRMDAAFGFYPSPAAQAVAFGERAGRFENWRSPTAHPAYVYMGPVAPVETDEVMAIVDPDAPQWIIDEFYDLTPRIFARLADAFGFALETKPNLFLAAPPGGEAGRLSYAGDAVPGQVQITLEGRAWARPSDKALAIFRRSTIHEAVHLWQAGARPGADGAPDWIHEGAADAVAAETLVALGIWDGAAYEADFAAARAECAERLETGSLAGAEGRQDYRAAYACGHVIAGAVSWADDASVADFWRDFIVRTAATNGYTEATFLALVRERTGAAFADALRSFIRTPPADPEREIDRLLAAAGAPLAPSGAR